MGKHKQIDSNSLYVSDSLIICSHIYSFSFNYKNEVHLTQVATALLVAGPTLTMWIPGQTVCIHQLVLKHFQTLPVQWLVLINAQ